MSHSMLMPPDVISDGGNWDMVKELQMSASDCQRLQMSADLCKCAC